ncbi:TPA: hypothetical protein I9Y90_000061 [Elizabethkingia anophelis]|nr:hypothetical protein [Elizabethkingia anophelis]HAT4009584.1 hypothetical protein [Elizabethkingia anophelis]
MNELRIEIPEGYKIDTFDKVTGVVKFAEKPKDIKDRVKSFEDACDVLGVTPQNPDLETIPTKLQKPLFAHYKLCIIAMALNEGWEPDWDNDDEYKYYPYFDMEGSSSGGFSSDGCAYVYSASLVGSRLCFKSRDLAEYAGKQFETIYREYFVIE